MPTPFSVASYSYGGLPTALFAQWPSYPTPGVPKTPDGKPNLTAPAPKTADGKPDFSGIWQNYRVPSPAGAAGRAPKSKTLRRTTI